jgi:hypothetical protein
MAPHYFAEMRIRLPLEVEAMAITMQDAPEEAT